MYIVADIGGTKTRIARSQDTESFDSPIVIDSIPSYEEGIAKIIETAKSLAGKEKIDAIALDITGVISQDGKTPLTAPHLQDWRGKSVARELEAALGARVRITNDTAQVGLGEAVYGAGKGANILVYVTVSTGVNGVRLVNQTIDPAAYGFEIGGQYIIVDGAKKSLEDLVSGKAIQERYGVHPKVIEKDSPVWEELAEMFAIGLHNTILHWSPDRVVLGGSMFNEIGISIDRVQAHLAKIMIKFPQVPEIVHSSLGDLGGLWGGLARLKQLT